MPRYPTTSTRRLAQELDNMTTQTSDTTNATTAKPPDLQARNAIVTGGTRGIGAAIAAELGRHGASVVVSARRPASAELPNGAQLIVADAFTPAGAEQLAATAQEKLGEIDILVNNVGGASAFPGGLRTIPDGEWEMAPPAHHHPAYVSLTNNTV